MTSRFKQAGHFFGRARHANLVTSILTMTDKDSDCEHDKLISLWMQEELKGILQKEGPRYQHVPLWLLRLYQGHLRREKIKHGRVSTAFRFINDPMVGRFLDHYGSIKCGDGAALFVCQPYNLDAKMVREINEFCKKLEGVTFTLSPNSFWGNGTWLVLFHPRGEAGK